MSGQFSGISELADLELPNPDGDGDGTQKPPESTTAAPESVDDILDSISQEEETEFGDGGAKPPAATTAAGGAEDPNKPPVYTPRPQWTAEQQEAFKALPDEFKKNILERHSGVDREQSEFHERARPVLESIGRLEPLAQYHQLPPAVMLNNMIGLFEQAAPLANQFQTTPGMLMSSMLESINKMASGTDEQKVSALVDQGMRFGVDLKQVLEEGAMQLARNILAQRGVEVPQELLQQQQRSVRSDPEFQALQQELNQLKSTLGQAQQTHQQQQTWQEQQYQQHAEQTLQGMLTATDDQGNLRFPYLNHVRETMAAAVGKYQDRTGQPFPIASLEPLYHKAVEFEQKRAQAMGLALPNGKTVPPLSARTKKPTTAPATTTVPEDEEDAAEKAVAQFMQVSGNRIGG